MIVALIDESDLHKWTITMDGPPGSPYAVRKNTTISKTFVACKLSVTSHPSQRSQNILAQPVSRREILQNSPGQVRLSTLDNFPPNF
jgi:hypothetical protein